MRAKRTAQISLFDPQALDHPVADELEWRGDLTVP